MLLILPDMFREIKLVKSKLKSLRQQTIWKYEEYSNKTNEVKCVNVHSVRKDNNLKHVR